MKEHFCQAMEEYDAYTTKALSLDKERQAWQSVYRKILSTGGNKILNAGCGPGTEAIALAQMGFEVTAFDFSPQMLEATRAHASEYEVQLETVEGDAEHLPFPDGSFDYVVSNYMMWAVPNPQNAINEFHRVLKNDGILAYADTRKETEKRSWFHRIWVKKAMKMRDMDHNGHRNDTTPEQKEFFKGLWCYIEDRPAKDLEMVDAAGFRDVRVDRKLNKKVYKGSRFIEYGYTDAFMIIARK